MNMKALAKQLKTKQLAPKSVIFDFGTTKWVFSNPQVVEANMMGQLMYQVMGKYETKKAELEPTKEDIELVMEKTGCNEVKATEALKKHNDVAEAILDIMNE